MARAVLNDVTIAESDEVVMVEGNAYFPPDTVDHRYLEESDRQTWCYWKGRASYYDVVVDGVRLPGAAWYYPSPSPLARRIKDHVAFWRGVEVID